MWQKIKLAENNRRNCCNVKKTPTIQFENQKTNWTLTISLDFQLKHVFCWQTTFASEILFSRQFYHQIKSFLLNIKTHLSVGIYETRRIERFNWFKMFCSNYTIELNGWSIDSRAIELKSKPQFRYMPFEWKKMYEKQKSKAKNIHFITFGWPFNTNKFYEIDMNFICVLNVIIR